MHRLEPLLQQLLFVGAALAPSGCASIAAAPSYRLSATQYDPNTQGDRDHDRRLDDATLAPTSRASRRTAARRGIDGARIETRGAGGDEPIDTNATARGRARNRRIELTILLQ